MWNNANEIFPTGFSPDINGIIYSNDRLPESGIEFIRCVKPKFARKMLIQENSQIWGSEGQYAEAIDYNIYSQTFHPDDKWLPLSVYGQSMINNYLYFHDMDA